MISLIDLGNDSKVDHENPIGLRINSVNLTIRISVLLCNADIRIA